MSFRFWIITILLAAGLAACAPEVTPTPQQTPKIELTEPVPVTLERPLKSETQIPSIPSPPFSLYPIKDVPSGYISDIHWSPDSRIIFIEIWNGGVRKNWAYNLEEQTGVFVADNPITPNPQVDSIAPLVSQNVPGNTVTNVSPSGQKAILLSSVLPTLTQVPPPADKPSYLADLWLWQEDRVQKIGQIQVCGSMRFKWSTNELYAAVESPGISPTCSDGWLIDTEQGLLHSMLPFDEFFGFADFHSFSPTGDKLLIAYQGRDDKSSFHRIRLIELPALRQIDLKISQYVHPVGWFNNETLLILHTSEEPHRQPALLNLQSGETIELLTLEQMKNFHGISLAPITFSPNRQWLAFAGDYSSDGGMFWLLKLDE
jgi:hypothetical protein